MNRRDYLKQMGIGAAAIAGSQLEVFAQHPHRRNTGKVAAKASTTPDDGMQTEAQLAENFQRWPPTLSRPSGPTIISVSLHGLLDFYYNDDTHPEADKKNSCGIGFHRGAGNHRARVHITKDGEPLPEWQLVPINSNPEVKLGIENKPASVQFLKSHQPDDFRRMIDMQSESWYSDVPTKTTPNGIYAARLFIRHGTFFTLAPTALSLKKVFKVESAVPPISNIPVPIGGDLGKPAAHVGCDILLNGTEKVVLRVNGRVISLPEDGQTGRYEVAFSNTCYDNQAQVCHFDWRNFRESLRNDFHHHRDILRLPGYAIRYAVILAEVPSLTVLGNEDKANSADAPCMAAGYGGGNGPCSC